MSIGGRISEGDRPSGPREAPGKVLVFSRAWLFYFMLMLTLIGGILVYAAAGPFYLLGRVYPPAHGVAGKILCFAVYLLLRVEPWLNADIAIAPCPGNLLVSNHRSHLDAFFLLSRIPNIRMVCRESLFRIPFLGLMMRAMRQIPVREKDTASYFQAMEQVRKALLAKESVHIFAEMTRCSPGTVGTARFHLAPFNVAFQEKLPVVPLVFKGTDRAWPKGVFGVSFRAPVRAVTLEALHPEAFASAAELAAETRKRIERFLAERNA